MDDATKKKIKKKNEQIRKAILVSQMQDHKGFAIFMEDMEEATKEHQFQDVRALEDMDVVNKSKGYVQYSEDMKHYFASQKTYALQPMTDEDTGEEETLNSKK